MLFIRTMILKQTKIMYAVHAANFVHAIHAIRCNHAVSFLPHNIHTIHAVICFPRDPRRLF